MGQMESLSFAKKTAGRSNAMRPLSSLSLPLFVAGAIATAFATAHALESTTVQTCARDGGVVNMKLGLDSLEAEFACPDSHDDLEPTDMTRVLDANCSVEMALKSVLPEAKLQRSEAGSFKLTVSRVADVNRRLCYRCKKNTVSQAEKSCTILIDVPGLMECKMDTATLTVRSGESASFRCGASLLFRPDNESEAFGTAGGRCKAVPSSLSQLLPGSTLTVANGTRTLSIVGSPRVDQELCFQCLDPVTQTRACTLLVLVPSSPEPVPKSAAVKQGKLHFLWLVGLAVFYRRAVH